jgi:glutamate synthase domain-containing protein 2
MANNSEESQGSQKAVMAVMMMMMIMTAVSVNPKEQNCKVCSEFSRTIIGTEQNNSESSILGIHFTQIEEEHINRSTATLRNDVMYAYFVHSNEQLSLVVQPLQDAIIELIPSSRNRRNK